MKTLYYLVERVQNLVTSLFGVPTGGTRYRDGDSESTKFSTASPSNLNLDLKFLKIYMYM